MCTETDTGVDSPTDSAYYSTAAPAIGNPEYFEKDADELWTAPGATVGDADDEGSYLTCGTAAAGGDYYDYSRGQMIAA